MRHARQAFETRHRQAVLVVRSGRIRVAGIARNDRVCRGPPTIRAPGVKTASGIDRRRDPPRPAITSRLAAPTRRPIMFRPRHDLQAFPSSVGSARKEEGQNPSAVNQIGTRPPGRWGNARRCTAPPAAVKTSNPRLSPRDRSRRRWQPGSGRESWPQGQLTFECTPIAGVCVRGPKTLLGLVRGRGHRSTRRHRPGPSPTEPARRGIIERDCDPRRPQIENRDIRALAIEPITRVPRSAEEIRAVAIPPSGEELPKDQVHERG